MNGAFALKRFKGHYTIPLLKSLRTIAVAGGAYFPDDDFHVPLTSLQCGTMLQWLTNSKSFSEGQQLHAFMLTGGNLQNNTYLDTKLAAFYAGCGRMDEAQVVFDGIQLKNSFLWNFMIRGYASVGNALKALALYHDMLCFGQKADNFTYPFVLKACGDLMLVEIGSLVHGKLTAVGLESDIYVGNSLIAMYVKFGDMSQARKMFDKMPERDVTSWNTMLSGHGNNKELIEAFVFFDRMRKSGIDPDGTTLLILLSACADLAAVKPGKEIHGYVIRNRYFSANQFLANSLIEMYSNCNYIAGSRRVFEELKVKDSVSWNSLISGYERNGDALESLRLFCCMVREGANPDEVTILSVLGACDKITALYFGKSIHSFLVKKGFFANTFLGTALIDMYAKCGSLSCSRNVFEGMHQKNLFTWTAMVGGLGIHGRGKEAVSLFYEMIGNGFVPDEGVLASVLSACSHSRLVDEGKRIFREMTDKYSVKPRSAHYGCLVDLLGRAGHLNEAYELIKNTEVELTGDVWTAFLSACRLHKNINLAEIAARSAFEMSPKGVGSYVCLSNIYAAEKRWVDVDRIRAMMRKRGLKKPAGYSYVELDKMIHMFFVGDRSHRQAESIYAKLEDLKQQLKEAGYKPDTSSVFYDVEEEVKERMLWDHSERLAIAFSLLNTGPGTTIRITKNLRVCRDCHAVTKLISKLACREIVMRDYHRFHHFRDGHCSCGDYW